MAGDTLRHDGHEVGRGDDAGKHEEVLQADRYAVLEAAGDQGLLDDAVAPAAWGDDGPTALFTLLTA